MKALTVQQPWAWAIIDGGKTVENRRQQWKYRGPLAIHAGKAWSDHGGNSELVNGAWRVAMDAERRASATWAPGEYSKVSARWVARGAIIGVVDLVDVHHCFNAYTNFEGCSPWAEPDAWHLVLENARPLAEPILCKGALGLWTPPADVVERIQAALNG